MATVKISNDSTLRVKNIIRKFKQARNLIMDSNGSQCGIAHDMPWYPNDGSAPSIISGDSLNAPSSTVFSFTPNTTSMTLQDMPTPTLNHVYYGGCMFRSEAGFSAGDGRFEWFYNDAENGKLVFSVRTSSTNGEWVLYSGRGMLTSLASQTGWKIRNFIVNGTTACYSCKHIIIDLTETFGAGKEPSKEWCDKALREWRTFDGYNIASDALTTENYEEYFNNSTGTFDKFGYGELDSFEDPKEPSYCYYVNSINPEVYLFLMTTKPPLINGHYLYIGWNEYVKSILEYSDWVQTSRDIYCPEAEPSFMAGIYPNKSMFADGGGFKRHIRISGYNNNRGFSQNPAPTLRLDFNGINVPLFARLYNFFIIDVSDNCTLLQKYQLKYGGTTPLASQLSKEWCDYWLAGRSLPILHIGDPETYTGFDRDYNFICNDVELHPEIDGLYIEDNGVVWCKGINYSEGGVIVGSVSFPVIYQEENTIFITCSTQGASIYYTTDGSTPSSNSTLYSSSFTITASCTVKAIGVREGYTNSGIVEFNAKYLLPLCATPSISQSGNVVTFTCTTQGATIYYSGCGISGSVSSGGSATITQSGVMTAYATANGYRQSGNVQYTCTYSSYPAVGSKLPTPNIAVSYSGVNVTFTWNNWSSYDAFEENPSAGIALEWDYGEGYNDSSRTETIARYNVTNPVRFRAREYVNGGIYLNSDVSQINVTLPVSSWPWINNGMTNNSRIQSFAYGNGVYVAVSDSSEIAYSYNGTSWTPLEFYELFQREHDLNCVAFGGGRFVVGGEDGIGLYSTNGVNWSVISDTTMGSSDIDSIAYGGGRFLLGANQKIAYSTNGTSWTLNNSFFTSVDDTISTDAIVYFNSYFYVLGNKSIYRTSNGSSGTTIDIISSLFPNEVDSWNLGKITCSQNRLLVFAEKTDENFNVTDIAFLTSTNGTTWRKTSQLYLSWFANIEVEIAYGGGVFVALAYGLLDTTVYVYYSETGEDFRLSTSFEIGDYENSLRGLRYVNNRFMVGSNDGVMHYCIPN